MGYDYLVVGAGLYGAVFAHEAVAAGKKVLVIDKRAHIAGNTYTRGDKGIWVHEYGAHIFHTSNKRVWDYVNQFATFNRYTNSPIARYRDEVYNLPFNMNTFHQMWGVTTPEEAKAKIAEQIAEAGIRKPQNLEEQAISLVGRDIYEKLVKGYTEKQWGRRATELPAFIIKRLPVRFVYDNNYFDDTYQGIPVGGYTGMVMNMLSGMEVRLEADYFKDREYYESLAEKVIFTGMIDEYFDYCYGELEYRSLRFEMEQLPIENYQGNAVVNYTEYEVPYTRIIEHKHFELPYQTTCQRAERTVGKTAANSQKREPYTVITREYPCSWKRGAEPYYPMNDEKNNILFEKYKRLADERKNVIFGGRLGAYQYYDMHQVIEAALKMAEQEL